MQGNAKNALILLLLGGPLFMGHPVGDTFFDKILKTRKAFFHDFFEILGSGSLLELE